jgi:hypothetical protein
MKLCKLIQWKKLSTLNGEAVCPECHEPAEMVTGIFGEPVWAHTPVALPRARKSSPEEEPDSPVGARGP